MAEPSNRNQRVVTFTRGGAADIIGIDNSTAAMWGVEQAERYLAFLDGIFEQLARYPDQGDEVDGRDGIWVFTAKYSRRKSAYGHRIFYRIMPGGIEIYRVLHTAMQWPDHL